MPPSIFLQAFEGTNKTVPVWFMRQAGRYLPQYRKLKEKYSLDEMFKNNELAAEITCQPISALGVDAAILFADILTLPSLMGVGVSFHNTQGPLIEGAEDFLKLDDINSASYVEKTVKNVRARLPLNIAFIGFAGSPFTVFTYLIEKKSSLNLFKTIKFIEENQKLYHQWMGKITKNTITYLNCQIKSGVDAIQLFDTWAGILRPSDYAHWVLPYVREIFEAVDAPSIYYVKNCHHLLALMDQSSADFLSVCHTVVIGHHQVIEKTKKGIQGNLYNGLLYADKKIIEREVQDVLAGAAKHERYIFNLSHGVFPDTDVDKLKAIVDQVHKFPWKK